MKQKPYRELFGKDELEMVQRVFERAAENRVDFGYQSHFEDLYTQRFCDLMGGGYADAVSSGTAAVYVALASLHLEKGAEVLVGPVTDPGGVSPILLQGFDLNIVDSNGSSFNLCPGDFEKKISTKTKALVVTHAGGEACEMDAIMDIARKNKIKVIEDCSQAHGSTFNGKLVGTFGDISAFSTMFSKCHGSGGCGGLVYTQNEELYWLARAHADRGKEFNRTDFYGKDPAQFLFPALNFNQNEIASAIGYSTLGKLNEMMQLRRQYLRHLENELHEVSQACRVKSFDHSLSPFYHFIEVDTERLKVSKDEFAHELLSLGASINPSYRYMVCDWPWVEKYLGHPVAQTPEAREYRDRSFTYLFHEGYSSDDRQEFIDLVRKVETKYLR